MAKQFVQYTLQLTVEQQADLDRAASSMQMSRPGVVRTTVRLCSELTQADVGALTQLASERGVSAAALLRQLVRLAAGLPEAGQ